MLSPSDSVDQRVEVYVEVGSVDRFPPGKPSYVEISGKDVCVVRTLSDRFYAVKNRCPHQGAPLCLGEVDGAFVSPAPGVFEFSTDYHVIRCPYHGYEYDLETGRPAFVTGVKQRVVRSDVQ